MEPHDSLAIFCWDATGVLRKVVCKPRCWRLLVAFTPSWCSQHGMHGKHIMRRKFGEDFTRPNFPGRDGSEMVIKLDKLPQKFLYYSTSMAFRVLNVESHTGLSSKPQGFPLYKPVLWSGIWWGLKQDTCSSNGIVVGWSWRHMSSPWQRKISKFRWRLVGCDQIQ